MPIRRVSVSSHHLSKAYFVKRPADETLFRARSTVERIAEPLVEAPRALVARHYPQRDLRVAAGGRLAKGVLAQCATRAAAPAIRMDIDRIDFRHVGRFVVARRAKAAKAGERALHFGQR